MKTPLLVLAAAIVALSACEIFGNRGGVNLGDTYLEINPGTRFSPDDTKALNKILSEYDKKLYWVATVDGSKITDTGKLSYVYCNYPFLNEVAKAETDGISYSAIQIGARYHSPHVPDHSPHVPDHSPHVPMLTTHPSAPAHSPHVPMMTQHSPHPTSVLSNDDYRKCTELVKRVTPILQNYSQKK